METSDDSCGIDEISAAQATRHVIHDVTHHQPPASVSRLIHYGDSAPQYHTANSRVLQDADL